MHKQMASFQYIFISDEGRIFSTSDEPTPEDFEYARVGMMTIIRVADGFCYGLEKKWRPIPRGQLGTTNVEGKDTAPFHAVETFFQETPSQ